ncbi:MAG: fibronectin type III domain-containing protein, partial [Rhodospirillales bacterium]|nr:fibronectin type III domain-containing protein [Rhodospirillales bacterium]
MKCARRLAGARKPAPSTPAASSRPDPRPGRYRVRFSLFPALALVLCGLYLLAAAPASAQTAPSVPQNVLVVSDDNKLTLTWVPPESWGTWEEEHFEINWKLSASNAWCTRSSPATSWCSERIEFTDYRFVFEGTKTVGGGNTHTVANGTVYDLRIRAVSQKPGTSGEENSHFLGSAWVTVSGPPEAHTHGPLPGIPTLAGVESGPSAPTADTLSFTVSCVSPGRAGGTDYVLRIVNAGDGSEVQLAYLPGPVPACRHTDPAELLNVQVRGLTAATTYRVRAFARNLVGRISPWSNPVELATTASADPNSIITGPGVVASATELGVSVGGTATYTVKLGAPPTDIVSVTPTVADGTKASVSPAQLLFSQADWNEAQTVTVSGAAAGETSVLHAVSTLDPAFAHAIHPTVKITVSATGQQGTNPHAALIAQMYEWRNDPKWRSYKAHTDRWDRALKAFGETV